MLTSWKRLKLDIDYRNRFILSHYSRYKTIILTDINLVVSTTGIQHNTYSTVTQRAEHYWFLNYKLRHIYWVVSALGRFCEVLSDFFGWIAPGTVRFAPSVFSICAVTLVLSRPCSRSSSVIVRWRYQY